MKRTIGLFGLLGLIGCFLPFALGVSWFDLRGLDSAVWLVMAAYAVPAIIGFTGADRSKGGQIAAAVSFGYILVRFGTETIDLFIHTSIGGILMGVGVVGGIVASVSTLLAGRDS